MKKHFQPNISKFSDRLLGSSTSPNVTQRGDKSIKVSSPSSSVPSQMWTPSNASTKKRYGEKGGGGATEDTPFNTSSSSSSGWGSVRKKAKTTIKAT